MQIEVFSVPLEGDPEATEALNRFLRSHRVLRTEKVAVTSEGRSYWSILVEYLLGKAGDVKSTKEPTRASPKSRIDYREVLDELAFGRFSKLREYRKAQAEKEGIPVYAMFTNAQLAEIATKIPSSKSALARLEGIGDAKIERYGSGVLDVLASSGGDEVPVASGTDVVENSDSRMTPNEKG